MSAKYEDSPNAEMSVSSADAILTRSGPDRALITRLFLCGMRVANIAASVDIESTEVEAILRLALVFAQVEQAMKLPPAEGAPGIGDAMATIP